MFSSEELNEIREIVKTRTERNICAGMVYNALATRLAAGYDVSEAVIDEHIALVLRVRQRLQTLAK